MKIIIIGAGPGGYETALLAAKRGVEVTLIESGPVGGTCLNEGCIPTKAFCRNARVMDEIRGASAFGFHDVAYSFDFKSVVERKNVVVQQLRSGVEGLLAHKMINFVRGRAYFKDADTVCVDADGEVMEFMADYTIMATGSVPASLPVPGADLPGVLTSREILDSEDVPRRLCVIGGGVIGLEFASIFNSFGSEVTVLEYCKDILPRFDSDLSKRLRQSFGRKGIVINVQSQVTGIRNCGNGEEYEVSFLRKGCEEIVVADKVLMAVGRKPAVSSLNLEAAGVVYTPKGIAVNEFMQTNVPSIYAIGDVNGIMMLAHAAVFQGIVALDHIMGQENGINLSVIPSAVFTVPEAACVGKTEEDCKAEGIAFRCLKSFFRANGKAVAMGEPEGFCKIIVSDDGQEKILGCHLFGVHSADIVQEMCALITCGATVGQVRDVIHAHPTLSEVLQSAFHA